MVPCQRVDLYVFDLVSHVSLSHPLKVSGWNQRFVACPSDRVIGSMTGKRKGEKLVILHTSIQQLSTGTGGAQSEALQSVRGDDGRDEHRRTFAQSGGSCNRR